MEYILFLLMKHWAALQQPAVEPVAVSTAAPADATPPADALPFGDPSGA